jgi:amidase
VGRVPSWYGPREQDQLLGVQNMLVQGPLARSVADARLGLAAMATWSPDEPFCMPVPLLGVPLPRPVRVAVVRDVGIMSPDPAVGSAITVAAQALEAAGYVVEEVELPLLAEAWQLWWQLVQGIEFSELAPAIEELGDAAIRKSADNQFAVARRMSGDFGLEAYMRGYARRGTLVRDVQLFLQEYPLVITPVSAERTLEIDADVRGMERMLGFPALSVPVSNPDGVPVSVQAIGRKFREDTLFDAGA